MNGPEAFALGMGILAGAAVFEVVWARRHPAPPPGPQPWWMTMGWPPRRPWADRIREALGQPTARERESERATQRLGDDVVAGAETLCRQAAAG